MPRGVCAFYNFARAGNTPVNLIAVNTTPGIKSTARRLLKQLAGRDVWQGVQVKKNTLFTGSSYGGWHICPDGIDSGSIIYSFGAGEDISFDLGMIGKFGTKVFVFDPTPKSIAWIKAQELPALLKFYEYGIAGYDGTAKFFPPGNPAHVSHSVVEKKDSSREAIEVPVRRLQTIMQELGHSKIDILKMDIEGAEYEAVEDILLSGIPVSQVLVEFHHRFKSIPVSATRKAIDALNRNGYRIFAVSGSGEEYSFIKI